MTGAQAALRGRSSGRSTWAIRTFDVLVAAVALTLLSPLLAAVAAGVWLDDGGPVLFRSRRVGRGGRTFLMLKFRKMRGDATGPALTVAGDDRLTRLGRVLVRFKLDELPQLWNVLRGDMSLVGPRPEDPSYVALLGDEYRPILAVVPGVTGLSQLAYAREGEILDANDRHADYLRRVLPQKMLLDTLYVRRRSLRLNLSILGWTAVAIVLRREVAVDRATGALGIRRRPSPPRARRRVDELVPVAAAEGRRR
jgi:lipopolysaccharide/colanic/teichoic acid biosynthesis glycosyltransferase